MPETLYLDLMRFSREVAVALEKTVPCKRVGMSVIGLEVPHVHVHLIPLNDMKQMTFQQKVTQSEGELNALAKQIANNLV
jgi:histidine triad (HIT) family protein